MEEVTVDLLILTTVWAAIAWFTYRLQKIEAMLKPPLFIDRDTGRSIALPTHIDDSVYYSEPDSYDESKDNQNFPRFALRELPDEWEVAPDAPEDEDKRKPL